MAPSASYDVKVKFRTDLDPNWVGTGRAPIEKTFKSVKTWMDVLKAHKLTNYLDPKLYGIETVRKSIPAKLTDQIGKLSEKKKKKSEVCVKLVKLPIKGPVVVKEEVLEEMILPNTIFRNPTSFTGGDTATVPTPTTSRVPKEYMEDEDDVSQLEDARQEANAKLWKANALKKMEKIHYKSFHDGKLQWLKMEEQLRRKIYIKIPNLAYIISQMFSEDASPYGNDK